MLTIAWDIDDVLNDLMYAWYTYKWLPEHPACDIDYNQLLENPPHNILKVKKEEYLSSLDEFRLSDGYEKIKPCLKILTWFKQHGSRTRHIALTAVPSSSASVSAAWVIKHFGKWIRTFHFIPSYRDDKDDIEYDKTKTEYIKWCDKIDILIDDNQNNISGLDDIGKKGIVVSKPWNKSDQDIDQVLTKITKIIERENND